MKHTFRNGRAVEAHQHPNGGGWVSDDSTVSEDSLVDKTSEVINSQVDDYSQVIDSRVIYSRVFDSQVEHSRVEHGDVETSQVIDSQVIDGRVEDSRVEHSDLKQANLHHNTVKSTIDVLVVGPVGSREEFTTFVKPDRTVNTGCWHGTFEEFGERVKTTYPDLDNEHRKTYLAVLELIEKLWESAAVSLDRFLI